MKEVLEEDPGIIHSILAKIVPWEKLSTKDDLRQTIDISEKRFEEMLHYSEKRFESVEKHLNSIEKRFEEMLHYSEKRFESVEKRLDEVNSRIALLEKAVIGFNLTILGALISILMKLLFFS
ncbi:hypothetical protein DRN46_04165 [Thermococci archaeon]|nr:MAG: hypothetical protein DRN46_04165 [Thermococci archaeon]